MERILTQNNASMEKECSEKKGRYLITIRKKKNGYEARVTIKIIGGGSNPRITAYGASKKEAVLKMLYKVKEKLIEYKSMNLLNGKILLDIQNSIVSSIKELEIYDEVILFEATSILTLLTGQDSIINTFIDEKNENVVSELNNEIVISNNNLKPIKSKDFKSLSLEWFKYKYKFTQESVENVNPLSYRTLDGYHQIITNNLIPYFKGNKNVSLITENDYKKFLLSINGARHRESVYFVLKMILDYAKEKKYICYIPKIEKPQKPKKRKEKEILSIDPDKQDIWLNKFEELSTDMSLLFETLLLEGLRPEERLRFEMEIYKF